MQKAGAVFTALIAEDEALLASALRAELARAWPALKVIASVSDGASAVRAALEHRPDILFFDIRMPGMGGLEAAAEIADAWTMPEGGGQPFPALVFVTAYDQYAVQAFEAQAMDYLLKPVQPARLQKTVAKLQQLLSRRSDAAVLREPAGSANGDLDHTLAQLRKLLETPAGTARAAPLSMLQASIGSAIHMVGLPKSCTSKAADKYVRVLTEKREYLIRTPLRELLPQLDTRQFWQIHRATVVRAAAIDSVSRDEAGRLWLHLRLRPERLPVSRLYAHLFKAM